MGAVVDPLTRCRDPLAGGDDSGVADHRHQITVSARLGPQDAKAIFGVVVGHPLDQAGEDFECLRSAVFAHLLLAPGS